MAALKANNEAVMKALYIFNYKKVEAYVLQNSGTSSEAKDLYQEAFITVWQNIRDDAFIPKNETSLEGYLYQIAKNKWIDHLRSAYHKKTVSDSQLHLVPQADEGITESSEYEEKMQHITNAFSKLGEQCKELLQQFYYKQKNYKDIAHDTGLKEASLRNQKYRCMQKLKEIAQNANNRQP